MLGGREGGVFGAYSDNTVAAVLLMSSASVRNHIQLFPRLFCRTTLITSNQLKSGRGGWGGKGERRGKKGGGGGGEKGGDPDRVYRWFYPLCTQSCSVGTTFAQVDTLLRGQSLGFYYTSAH